MLLPLFMLLGCQKKGSASLALEQCDPAGYISCIQPTAFVSIPIADSNLLLTYSSRWGADRSGQRGVDFSPLGLGGWSLSVVQKYDKDSRLLISGDGSWRSTDAVELPSGELAVPSFDASIVYVFDTAGRHIRTVDGHLGTELIEISYDGAGRLLLLVGSLNSRPVHVSVQRDTNGVPQALVGIDGATTRLALDGNGHLVGVTTPADETTRIAWNAAGLVESQTDAAGGTQHFTYDSSGQLASATDADGVVRYYERKASGDRVEISVSTALGRHWSYQAESGKAGIRRTFIRPDGTEDVQTTDFHGSRTLELADGTNWHIGTVANPVWGMASPVLTPIVETRSDGVSSRRDVKYGLHPQRGLPYLLAGSLTTEINNQLWTQHFDPAQRLATLVDPTGRRTAVRYDERGRLTSYSAPGVAPVSYTYNAEGRRTSKTLGEGALARTTRYTFDASTGQIITTRPDGVKNETRVDKVGRTLTTTMGDGSTIVLGYDSAGRVNRVQPPGRSNYILGASPAGRPTAFVPPMVPGDASIETRSYDEDGRLATISGLGNRAIAYIYDSAGRVKSSATDLGKRTFSYDTRSGLVTQSTDPSGVNTRYGYTGSTLTSLTWSGAVRGSVLVELDAVGRVAHEAVNGRSDLKFTYDSAGNLTGVGHLALTRDPVTGLVTHTTLGVIDTRQEFDEYDQLIRVTTTATGKLLLDTRYSRDALDRINTVTEAFGDGKSSKTEYSYDRADRLVTVRVNDRAIEAYNYDPVGNRVSVARTPERIDLSYDDRERLLSFGSTQYAWTPDGTLASVAQGKRATEFFFDAFGALRRARLPDTRKIKYLVDADGRRVGREVADRLVAGYLYRLDGSIAAETDAAGQIISRFGYDDLGHLALLERGDVIYRVITDQVGSPRLIVDSRTGGVVAQLAYDPWGHMTMDTGAGFIPIGFAGGLRDPDTGFIRFGARDYDPVAGRWTGPDPIRFAGGDPNLYRYVSGDPVDRDDPTGTVMCDEGMIEQISITSTGITFTCFPVPEPHDPPQVGNPPAGGGDTSSENCNWDSATFFVQLGGANPPGCGGDEQPPDPPPSKTPMIFCWACVYGDTHQEAANGLHFDFQAAGEFVAAASAEGKLVIQARQEPMHGGTDVTFSTAVAANVNGDRVGVYSKEPSFLIVNGMPLGGSDVEERLPHGGILQRHGWTVNLRWPDGTQLSIVHLAGTLNYAIVPASDDLLILDGLLGNSGSSAQELVGRDGATLDRSDPEFQTKLYRQFGNSWRVKQSESLFDYWPGESTATFTNVNIPSKEVRAHSLHAATRSKADAVCRAVGVRNQPALDDCVLDVGITGMPALAVASLEFGANSAQATSPGELTARVTSSVIRPSTTDEFSIKIGESVSADRPAKGAGIISRATQKQSYSFAGRSGESLYVSVGPCHGAALSLELRKSDNTVIDGVNSCRDFGPLILPAAGTYKIVAAASGGTRYSFSLRSAALNQFSIKIGDAISADHPTGAGIIAQSGQRQSYSFDARAGEVVYLGIGPCEGAVPAFDLLLPDDHFLDGQIGCHDLGREVLPQTGQYRLVAKSDKEPVRYGFFLHSVPADQHFIIRPPQTVSPDAPARGAGHITAQGAQQFYDFTATPGSKVLVEGKCGTPCPNLGIRVTSIGDTGSRGFLGLDHLNFDWRLPAGGQYTIQVRSDGYVGDYSFAASQAKATNH
jgi:RHS repeat-associated protein